MGLERIILRDFIIVQSIELDWEQGFTVLTGETGAGKSILIEALQLVTGGRADVSVVREGAQRCDVSAEFKLDSKLKNFMIESGFDANDQVLLRRTVDIQGKSRAWINGSQATAGQLRVLGENLLDIHGQHAWQGLTRPEEVMKLLDAYAQLDTSAINLAWQAWRQSKGSLLNAQVRQTQFKNECERLDWQLSEIGKLAPLADEWEVINVEHTRLSHTQALIDAAQEAVMRLEDGEHSAIRNMHLANSTLENQAKLEPAFESINDLLQSSLAQVQDCVHTLNSYLRKTEPDPNRLSQLDQRISNWLSLARRYKTEPTELPRLWKRWGEELIELQTTTDLNELTLAEKKARNEYIKEAQILSKGRSGAAPKLATAITQAMQQLGMVGGRFEVELRPALQPMQSGMEEVHFLVSGHPGSTPRPVGKVASGGELSRIALAIAVTTSQLGTAQTLIFDEVDAGIGGKVAQTVGQLMKKLGLDRQVLAITHLPQVAACADHHWVVSKHTSTESTISKVIKIQSDQRILEIARMLGGDLDSKSTIEHAKDMLANQL